MAAEKAAEQTTGPVRRVRTPAGDPAWQVDGYRQIKELLTDPRLGRSHPQPEQAARYSESGFIGQPNGSDPETERAEHARFRRVLSRSFSARRMQALRPRVTELASGLLDELGKQVPPVDFHERVSFPLPVLVICELLGVPYEDRDEFRVYSDQIADMTDQATSRAGMQGLFTYMTALVKRKRTKPGVDVISDLILAQETETFPEEGIASAAAGLLFAGHITTVNVIDRGVLLLCTNTGQRTALAADPGLVDRAVEEILRMPTPLPNTSRPVPVGPTRYAHADIDIGGVTIGAGDLVLLNARAANCDREVFTHPERFDITRTDNPHLTFGHGVHFCPGAPLARIELQALFKMLPARFSTLRPAVPVEELRTKTNLIFGGLTELPVTW
jgi:pentalenolactone synthase